MQFGAIALYFNKDLFERHGVDFPDGSWNWDDLLAAARVLTKDLDRDGIVDQYGLNIINSMEVVVANFVFQNADRTRILMDSPEAIAAVQFLVDLREKYGVAPGVNAPGMSGLGQLELFETGRVAMAFAGSWRMDYYNRPGQLDYDVARLPAGPDGRRGMCANGLANAMNSHSRVKEAAWKWIRFYTSERAQRLIGTWKRGIPSMERIAREPSGVFLNPNAPPESEQIFLAQMSEAHDLWPSVGYQEWMDRLSQELDAAFQGSKSVELALGDATRFGNQLMAGSLIVLLPEILLFVFMQRYFVEGIRLGALKR